MEQLGLMSEHFKMLGDKSRLTILALLKERELCVCEIVEIMRMSQPNVSQHLRKLKAAGLVFENRKGQWIYYSLNLSDKPHIQDALSYIPSLKNKIETITPVCCE
ncbi:metalloregulator ArsR/SmtB family transcription factor [Paenibacillus sp. GD4]|jgi:ArsR family transcriptional regulator, arsenate/arsenite/antimonite-responsive transcriptional repressor|uniref:ArsR/SmtB family transcription factor n=1 Tax=Paenibacillus sp. GD4 TaxID=3068890 RepID=UPI00279654B0|nr:metalloregulator ArsR/SmtB family transcription factor [Paenibacillus sp. GD4]MDQ1914009.1 metalloregulator ArsR/SmtB family transcription factor [Paenibacillus sp. GD4]